MPLLWLSLTFVVGIVMGRNLTWSWLTWLGLSLGCLLLPVLGLLFKRLRHRNPRIPALPTVALKTPLPLWLLLAVFFLGAMRVQLTHPALTAQSLSTYNDRQYDFVVEGWLISPPETRGENTLLHLKVEKLHPVGDPRFAVVEGLLLAYLASPADFHYGDQLRIQGRLKTPAEFETFSYRDYLARQGITSYMSQANALKIGSGAGNPIRAVLYQLRERAQQVIYQIFPDPEAALMAGILLGVEGGISEEVYDAFRQTGTAHIIAISGFNISIIAGMFIILAHRLFGKRGGILVALLGIALYTVLVGASAGVVRAALMSGMTLFASRLGRRQNGFNTLAFVGALMALFTPMVLWDVSFQLSFMATLGLVLFADPFTDSFESFAGRFLPKGAVKFLVGPVGAFILLTLAAQLTTLPLSIYYFGQLSLVSLIANLLILPAQPPLMILGGLAVITGLVFLPFGHALSYIAWPFPAFTIGVVEGLARLPYASLSLGPVGWGWVLLFFILLFGLVFLRQYLPALNKLWRPGLVLLGLGALVISVWRVALSAPDGRLHVLLMDVGTGDAVLVHTPGGRHILIDGGPSVVRLSESLGRWLPVGRRQLDWLVVAGTGEGQVGALPVVLERFPPMGVLWSGAPAGSYSSQELLKKVGNLGIPLHQAEVGQSLDLGDGVTLAMLDVSGHGAVLLLEYNSFRLLIPVGLDFEGIESLDPGPLSALLLAESGYAPLNPPEWIDRLQPQVVLLSVEAGDRNGLPDPGVVEKQHAASLLRTDQNGWIELSTDGEQMWVESAR
jgi:competence protein ComEC